MNVQLVPYEDHLYPAFYYIRSNLRGVDQDECFWHGLTPEQIPDDLLWRSSPFCYIAYADTEPVFVFGAAPVIPGVYQFWGFGTDDTPKVLPQLTKFCREEFAPDLYLAGVRRVQVHVPLKSQQSFRWLTEHIGMRVETIMSDYCADGSPMAQLVFTRQDFQEYVSFPKSTEAPKADTASDRRAEPAVRRGEPQTATVQLAWPRLNNPHQRFRYDRQCSNEHGHTWRRRQRLIPGLDKQ